MLKIDRRRFVLDGSALGAAMIATGAPLAAATRPKAPAGPFANEMGPRTRTILVNDVAGDPDGLYAAVHQMLSTSSELRAVVGTAGLATLPTENAAQSLARFKEMLQMTGLEGRVKAFEGAAGKITVPGVPVQSAGTQAIIDEARRTDTTSLSMWRSAAA